METKDKIFYGIIAVVVAVVCILLGMWLVQYTKDHPAPQCTWYYEWVDALGNYGTADNCYQDKGNLICRTDSTRRQVIEYTRVCK